MALVVTIALAAACAQDDPLAGPAPTDPVTGGGAGACDWPMYGHDAGRSFASTCPSGITSATVADLRRIWYVATDDVVSAAPVVVDGGLYVGDWTGVLYGLDAASGALRWRTQLATNPLQYGGQISASAAWASVGGRDALLVGSGRTVNAVAADDGSILWEHPLGREASTTEVLGSPLVAGNLVIVGFDAHGAPEPTGVVALDLATGEEVWWFDPESGTHRGCGGVWGSPSLDVDRGLVFVGTANCPSSRDGWGPHAEALIAIDVTTGEPRWSFQPRAEPDDRDADFAGAPNLFTAGDRDLVGLGNKDAHYYAIDRESGELVWATMVTEDGYISTDYSSGGFVGPSAVADGLVVGATAVGECPCLHAIDAATGEIVWQQTGVGPSYAPTTVVGDLAFVASIDTVLRAVDTATGDVMWADSLGVLASGGVAAVGDDLWAVAGFREPGSPGPSARSGVFRYSVDPTVEASTTTTSTTTTLPPDERPPVRLVDASGRCIDEPCELSFELKDPPPGTTPTITLSIRPDPFEITVRATDLGDPADWLQEGSPAADAGAVAYGVMISERDDDPNGGFLCVLDAELSCTGTTVPNPGASYSRISVIALADTATVPDAVDGFSRLVDTIAFDPPLRTELLSDGSPTGFETGTIVFSGQGNDLVAYDLEGNRRLMVANAGDDPENGRDINAQICFLDDRTFVAGEDTGQPEIVPGWGVFRLEGDTFEELTATQLGKLVPTYQEADSQPEMFGCGVLADGRVVLTDIGNQALGPGTGQLLLFFPPTPGDVSSYRGEITDHCKIDTEIATAQQIAIDGDDVLVASARPPTVGVWRYTDLPASLADCGGEPSKERFIDPADGDLGIANGLVRAPVGGWYVSSVFTGVINEYDRDGGFVREVLRPPAGETLGASPFSTGTPNGITVDAEGSLWYADLGIVIGDDGDIGPGPSTGTVRRIRFVDGDPQPPEIIDQGLAFPDALGVTP